MEPVQGKPSATRTQDVAPSVRRVTKPNRNPFGASAATASQLDRLAGPGNLASFPAEMQRAFGSQGSWLSRPVLGGRSEIESPFFDSWVVYACTRLLQRAVAGVSWKLWTGDDPEDGELPAQHPMVRFFSRPNSTMSWARLVGAGVIHRKLYGEDFWFLVDAQGAPLVRTDGDNAPAPLSRVPLPIRGPGDAQIVPVGGSAVFDERHEATGLVQAWWYAQASAVSQRFHTSSVIPFLDYNPADPCRGVGDAEVATRALSVAFQIERYQEAVMRNGGPGAFVVNENSMAVDEEARQQELLDARQEDPSSYGKLRLLSGKWSVIPNPATPKNLQSTEAMAYYRDVVASIFGVPLPCIGIMENATFRNSEEAWHQFWLGVVDYLRTVEDTINSVFLPSLADPSLAALKFGFDVDSISALREDRVAKVEAAANLANKGVGVSFNEAAEMLELEVEPAKFGDTAFVPSSSATAEQVIEGSTWTTPDPAGSAPASDAPAADDGDGADPEDAADTQDDAEQDAPAKAYKHPQLSEVERAAYYKRFDEDVIREGDKRLRAHVAAWFRRYHEETVRILRDVAENGTASKSARARAAFVAKDSPSADDVERYLMASRRKWRRLLHDAVSLDIDGVFQRAASDMAAELGSVSIPMSDPRVLEALAAQKIQLVEGVESTLADQVRRILLDGLGESTTVGTLQEAVRDVLPELEDSLAQAFATKDARAQTIARTETGHAANSARFMQMDAAGVKRQQWVASNDAATRESHRDLDGEVRDLGAPFKPRLRYPHDPQGPAEEVINCRCIAVPIDPEN